VLITPDGKHAKAATRVEGPADPPLRTEGVPSLLSGPPGTGKTSLVEAAFPDLITVAGDGDTTVGEYIQKPDGTYEFIYGPLIGAMQEGRVLFIDDATLISPAVLAVCYPAMDGRREVIVKAHKGEMTTAAEGFYVVAGHNPGVHGAVLNEALSSRFTFQFDVATDGMPTVRRSAPGP
jgi:nitric oxide reductase NorQ protein